MILVAIVSASLGLFVGSALAMSKINSLYDENARLDKNIISMKHELTVKDKQISLLNKEIEKLIEKVDKLENKKTKKTKAKDLDPIILDDDVAIDAMMENINEPSKKGKTKETPTTARKPSNKVSK